MVGTVATFSTRMAAEKPARLAVPKLFTTDCTSMRPMAIVACCRTEGTARRTIGLVRRTSRAFFPPRQPRVLWASAAAPTTAATYSAPTVEIAMPGTPMPRIAVEATSPHTFMSADITKRSNGVRESPIALNIAVTALSAKSAGRPTKYTAR